MYGFKGSPDSAILSHKRDVCCTEYDFLLWTFSSGRKRNSHFMTRLIEGLVPTSETCSTSYIHLNGQKDERKVQLDIFFILYCFLGTKVSTDLGHFSRFKY